MPTSDPKPTYLLDMMERLGVDPAGGVVAHSGLTYLTARHRCHSCGSKEECRAWLDQMPRSVSFAPRFCPNSELLFEVLYDQQGHIGGATTGLCGAHGTADAPAVNTPQKP